MWEERIFVWTLNKLKDEIHLGVKTNGEKVSRFDSALAFEQLTEERMEVLVKSFAASFILPQKYKYHPSIYFSPSYRGAG